MDLGLKGRTAIVCAASKGLGRACAEALAAEGVGLVLNARSAGPLAQAAAEIAQTHQVPVVPVAGDIASADVRAAILAAAPTPDILVNNAGGPAPGKLKSFTADDWTRALEGNLRAPAAMMAAVLDGMAARGFGRVVNITSGAVKAPIGVLGLSNGARSGLTGFVAGLARSGISGKGVTINALLPGAFDTDRLRSMMRASPDPAAAQKAREQTIPARRLGTAEEFGAMCAFICSVHAGYLTGQNILLDGGAYPGTF